MNTSRRLPHGPLPGLGLVGLALSASALGCSGDPGDGARASAEAVESFQPAFVNAFGLSLALDHVDARSSTFSVTNGTGTFVASPKLSAYLSPDAGTFTKTFPVPPKTISLSWPKPDLTVTVASINADMNSLSVDYNGKITVDMSMNGQLRVSPSSIWPDANLVIDRAALHAEIGWDASQQHLTADNVRVDLANHVSDCGAFGWCSAFYDALVPSDVGDQIAGIMKQQLADELAHDAGTTQAFTGAILAVWNAAHQGNGLPWELVSGLSTIRFDPAQVDFQVRRLEPPSKPTGLVVRHACVANVEIDLPEDQDPAYLLRDIGDGNGFQQVATCTASENFTQWSCTDFSAPALSTAIQYIVRRQNAVGNADSDPIAIPAPMSPNWVCAPASPPSEGLSSSTFWRCKNPTGCHGYRQ